MPPPSEEPRANRSRRRWTTAAKCFVYTGVASWFVAWTMYAWPDVTIAPSIKSGHIYPIRDHAVFVYWTHTEVVLNYALSIGAFVLIGIGFAIAFRLGLIEPPPIRRKYH